MQNARNALNTFKSVIPVWISRLLKMSDSMKITSEEMEKRLKMVESKCICKDCPTYQAFGREGAYIAYCFPTRGKSENISKEKGCTCGLCSVYAQMKFITAYYCTRDVEMKQKVAIAEAAWKGHSVWDHLRKQQDTPFGPRERSKITQHGRGHLPQERKRSGRKL